MTNRDTIKQALLTEMRKWIPNRYRIRKFKKMLRAYDYGFRDGTNRQHLPDFDGEAVSKLENGKATAMISTYGNLNYAEARYE